MAPDSVLLMVCWLPCTVHNAANQGHLARVVSSAKGVCRAADLVLSPSSTEDSDAIPGTVQKARRGGVSAAQLQGGHIYAALCTPCSITSSLLS